MEGILFLILKAAYAFTTALGLIGYVPTLKELLQGGNSANRNSYLIWTTTSVISLSYLLSVTNDFLLIISASTNLFFCLFIYLLTFKKVQLTVVRIF